jgi:hypothetical protein
MSWLLGGEGMPNHVVQPGENLSVIAHKYGFSDWRAVYNHPQNADFRRKRPNPQHVMPGDTVFIPENHLAGGAHPGPAGPLTEDDFESVEYDLDYRSEGGNLSKYLKARYRNSSQKDIPIDSVTNAQPRLWAAKQEVLKVMDDYNANFILGSAIPTVFFILTISPSITPVSELPGLRVQSTMS